MIDTPLSVMACVSAKSITSARNGWEISSGDVGSRKRYAPVIALEHRSRVTIEKLEEQDEIRKKKVGARAVVYIRLVD